MFPLSLDKPILFVDCESTGLGKADRLIEIALVRVEPDGKRTEYWTLIAPGIPIPAAATAIHGITEDDVLGKPRFEDIAPKLIRAFRGADIAGYGVRFDMELLQREFKRVGVSTETDNPPRVLDALRLWQLLEPRKLADAVNHFLGRAHEGAHNAKSDIDATIEVLAAQMTKFRGYTLDQLHALQFPTPENSVDKAGKILWNGNVATLGFGKHHGEPLAKVPRKYLEWLLTTDVAADTRLILERAVQGVYPVK